MYLLDHPNGGHWYPTRRTCQHGIDGPHIVVLHTSESLPDFVPPDDGAEALARYAAATDRQVSWHSTVDSDSTIPMLPDSYTAWHVRGYNRCSLGIEQVAKAADWVRTPYEWRTSVLDQCAAVVAAWSRAHSIPLRFVDRAAVDRGERGITFHSTLDPTRRSDPGQAYPLDYMLRQASKHAPSGHPVLGTAKATLTQAQSFTAARTTSSAYDVPTVRQIVSDTWRISGDEGVRADLALGLMLEETGHFRYGGDVRADQYNFGGIGATGGVAGNTFRTIAAGVHAVIRRMRMYAEGTAALHDLAILGRALPKSHWGTHPNIEDFDGVWAVPGVGYGASILSRAAAMAKVDAEPSVPFTDAQVAWLDTHYQRSG